jgi:glycerol-3-phosphate cytidylyltransferase
MKKNNKNKKIIGFTCGAFDLTHAGHYLMFEEVRKKCDYLIVGLHIDPSLDRKDKNKPIQTLKEREIQLKACKYIDKIIKYNTEVGLYKLLKTLKPDVRFIGIDWKNKPNYSRDRLSEIKVIYNSRSHNYSTTNLRDRIVKQHLKTQKK